MDSGQGAGRSPGSAGRSRAETPVQLSFGRRTNAVPQRVPLQSNNSSIRIRRLPSFNSKAGDSASSDAGSAGGRSSTDDPAVTGRRRSSSAPQRMTNLNVPGSDLNRHSTVDQYQPVMPSIQERTNSGTRPSPASREPSAPQPGPATISGRPRGLTDLHSAGSGLQAAYGAGNAARANRGLGRMRSGTVRSRPPSSAEDEYGDDVMGLLDLIDPEVQTLGTLTNVQNSLFVPNLGSLVNRRPTYELTSRPSSIRMAGAMDNLARSRAGTIRPPSGTASTMGKPPTVHGPQAEEPLVLGRRTSVSSQMTDSHWAVLPHGATLEGWSDEDIAELNDHVRHLLHSRQEGLKRSWRGFKKYLSKPLGLFVFVYAVLITLFGATWVIFLIGWIHVGDRQSYAVDVIDNVLVALFAVVGDGLAPFRAVDTYHMCFIAHFHHLTWRLREKKDMPKLPDRNDLPDRHMSELYEDIEAGKNTDDLDDKAEFSVLTSIQQRRLTYHQAKFSKSHTFYRPHETATHHAFPLRLLVAVVVLLDCHSLFQIALGTCTWSIDYTVRPEALTATILSFSITCNVAAGVLVSIGDKRTRKKEVLDKLFRQQITQEAMETIQKRNADSGKHYVQFEAKDNHDSSGHGKSKFPKELPRISLDLHRNEGHRPSKDISRITNDIPRVSHDMARLSEDIPRAVASRHSSAPRPS